MLFNMNTYLVQNNILISSDPILSLLRGLCPQCIPIDSSGELIQLHRVPLGQEDATLLIVARVVDGDRLKNRFRIILVNFSALSKSCSTPLYNNTVP